MTRSTNLISIQPNSINEEGGTEYRVYNREGHWILHYILAQPADNAALEFMRTDPEGFDKWMSEPMPERAA